MYLAKLYYEQRCSRCLRRTLCCILEGTCSGPSSPAQDAAVMAHMTLCACSGNYKGHGDAKLLTQEERIKLHIEGD